MYKLKITISKPANYIYHMLSVSKVGYDNSYGEKYRSIHNKDYLTLLKKYEELLTVKGGEHCGMLYVLLVAKPATADNISSLREYFDSLIDLFTNNNPEETASRYPDLDRVFLDEGVNSFEEVFEFCLNTFNDYSDEIINLSKILLNDITIYEKNVWNYESKVLLDFKNRLILDFDKTNDLVSKWENQLNKKMLVDNFEVVIVNSIEGGAQAIDISNTKDVFNINENIKSLIGFISHEIGTYIIFQNIPLSMRENMQKYWLCIESLATYHNQQLLYEDDHLFANDNIYFSKFDDIYRDQKNMSFVDVIEKAINA